MSLIANCLAKLVRTGQISQGAADAANRLHEGLQGKLNGQMPPAHADAAAALEAAKIMGEAAKREKLAVVKEAITHRNNVEYVMNHPFSKAAGVLGVLTRDIRGVGHVNWESSARFTEDYLLGKANAMIESYRSRLGGLKQDYIGPRNVIKELRGTDTGDAAAKEAAAAWKATTEAGEKRLEKSGIFFSQNQKEQWLHPQFWESSRVKKFGRETFQNDVIEAWRSGGLEVMDKLTGEKASDLAVPEIVGKAYEHIAINESGAARGSAFNDTMRVFQFKNADAYLKLMDKYGPGEGGIHAMMMGHIKGMAHHIAGVEVLGRNYVANGKRLLELSKLEDAEKGMLARLNPIRFIESQKAAEATFKMLTGEMDSVSSELMAGVFGATRNIASAANLGGAIITAVPGDSVSAMIAANYNGISGAKVIQRALEGLAKEGPELRAQAARLHITAQAVIDGMNTTRRFGDEANTAAFAQLSNLNIRAQGLNIHTENLKRAFSMEFLSHIAESAAKIFDELEPAFQGFLSRYGFTPENWDTIRASQPIDIEGAKYFDAEALADASLSNRLMSAIIDERQHAVLENSARIRQSLGGSLPRGTFWGEVARSASMYKSFPMAIMLTHGMRRMNGPDSFASKGMALGFKLLLPMTLAGAVSLQAKSLLALKDPRDMSDPGFWRDAFFTGGGSGLYGDLFKQAIDGGPQEKLGAVLGGPVGQATGAVSDLTLDQYNKWSNGDKTNFGKMMARHLKRWMPGSTFAYTRGLMDRFFFDEIQQAIDPDYLDSFRRQEENLKKNTGQKFWWRPGHKTPDRAPDFGQVLNLQKQSALPMAPGKRQVAAAKAKDLPQILAALKTPRKLHTDMAGKATGVAGLELPEVASDPRLQELLDALRKPKKFTTDADGNVTGVSIT